MKVKEILIMAAESAGRSDAAIYMDSGFAEDAEGTAEEVKVFLAAYNAVLCELATGYAPLVKVHVAKDATEILYADMEERPFEILSVTDRYGDGVAYEAERQKISFSKPQREVSVRYRYVPDNKGMEDDGDYDGGKITPRVISYGVASAYFSALGAKVQSANFREKFDKGVLNCVRPKRKMVMPGRFWR